MNKKKKLYLKVLDALKNILPNESDTNTYGMGWAEYSCPHIRIEVYPNGDQSSDNRTGGRPCHS